MQEVIKKIQELYSLLEQKVKYNDVQSAKISQDKKDMEVELEKSLRNKEKNLEQIKDVFKI